jgi:hypothetical protein
MVLALRRAGSLAIGKANQFGWFVLAIIVSSQRGGQSERSVVVGGFAALALMTAVAMTVVAAKTIEETAEAELGPTLRGQLVVASPVVLPNSAACCSPRRIGMDATVVISPRRADHQQHPQQLAHSCIFKQYPVPAFRLLADRGPGIPLAPIQLPKASRRHKV